MINSNKSQTHFIFFFHYWCDDHEGNKSSASLWTHLGVLGDSVTHIWLGQNLSIIVIIKSIRMFAYLQFKLLNLFFFISYRHSSTSNWINICLNHTFYSLRRLFQLIMLLEKHWTSEDHKKCGFFKSEKDNCSKD